MNYDTQGVLHIKFLQRKKKDENKSVTNSFMSPSTSKSPIIELIFLRMDAYCIFFFCLIPFSYRGIVIVSRRLRPTGGVNNIPVPA